MRRLRAALAAVLVAAALGGCGATGRPEATGVTSGRSPAPAPADAGSDRIGDSYCEKAGNGGYDVGDYDLNITYDPQAEELTGVATITATATQDLTRFNLDFAGPSVDSITVDGADAEWSHDGGELVVSPAAALASGQTFSTVVAYHGRPGTVPGPCVLDGGVYTSAEGAIAIGEPDVAAAWFPVNDHPRDKATYTIRLTVPDGLAALSNGALLSKEDAERDGYTTWTWRESSLMASYLATMVVGHYRLQESVHDGLPVILAVHSSLPRSVDEELARTPEVVDYLETVFGPYPFDALGGIVINEPRVGFALENQSRPIYGFFPRSDPSWLLAHELAHQWYGNSVSVHDWSEIWLNEGFATYAEWLWEEHEGRGTVQERFDREYLPEDAWLWQVPAGNPGREHIFSAPGSEYARGGMTLHALRVTVGDEAFFRILPEWASRKQDSTATTEEFIALAEEISGRQLDQLFQDWLYGTQRPPRP